MKFLSLLALVLGQASLSTCTTDDTDDNLIVNG